MRVERILLQLATILLAASALHAVPKTDWRAQWIWLPETADADMLLARKTFTLDTLPKHANLALTASSQYQLYVNGTYIASGPARCAPHHQSYDVRDIASALHKGKNVIALRVHHQREGVSYYGASRAGLLAQLDLPGTALQTDASWRVAPDASWSNESPRMAVFHLEVCDRVDSRKRADGWNNPEFDDTTWATARVLQREEGWPLPQKNDPPTHLIPPWTTLEARDLPYLEETTIQVQQLQIVEVADAPIERNAWIGAPPIRKIPIARSNEMLKTPATIQATAHNKHTVLICDTGTMQNGRPFLDIEGPAGTVVDIMAAPYLLDNAIQSPIVASTYVDRIILSGQRERWEAFYWKPARWIGVVFRNLSAEATIHAAGVVEQRYPFEKKGSFRAPDAPELEALWNAAANTIEVCTTDAYTDNYRERRQYAQTSYYAGLGNYPIFADYALQRRYLRQIAQEQLSNGIMPAYAPRHGDDFMVILDSNCFWLRGLHQYLLYSGDEDTVRQLLPAARNLLALLDSYTNADGLIDSPPYPYWLDHALNDRRGANFCLNGHYLGALEDFARILAWLDAPGADTVRERAARLRESLAGSFWSPEKQLFADALVNGNRSPQFSEHANAMALALTIGSSEQREAIAARLSNVEPHDFVRRPGDVIMVTPAMSYYLHVGLCENGHLDASLDLLWARFKHMLAPDMNGTLWEEWWREGTGRSGVFKPHGSGRSDAQTESAFPPALFMQYILGIEPTQPGLREVVLRYHDSKRLLHRQGALPTPTGRLEVEWKISSESLQLNLKTPPDMTIKIALESMGAPAPEQIVINGTAPRSPQLHGAFLQLAPGTYTIRIAR